MKRSHLSHHPDLHLGLSDVIHTQGNRYKPAGFWYQIDNSWKNWCEAEDFGTGDDYSNEYIFDIDLSKILIIDTPEKFIDFHNKYSITDKMLYGNKTINWKKVSNDYDGIEITHYLYQFRMEPQYMWYYGWDVASGVFGILILLNH